jgi:hypothetical protein
MSKQASTLLDTGCPQVYLLPINSSDLRESFTRPDFGPAVALSKVLVE